MQIAVSLDSARLFRWHLVLLEQLRAQGNAVNVLFRDSSEPLPISVTAILDFDQVRLRSGSDRLSVRMDRAAFKLFVASLIGAADLTIDLATSTKMIRSPGRVLRPLYGGHPRDIDLFIAVFEGRSTVLSVADTNFDTAWPIGLPAIEQPTCFSLTLDQMISRLVEGMLSIVQRIAAGEHPPMTAANSSANLPSPAKRSRLSGRSLLVSAAAFTSQRTSRKALQLRDRASGNAPRWHVAWRHAVGDAPITTSTLALPDFRILPDDGQRYYADPFLFVDGGVTHLFVEDVPKATNVGVISHTVVSPSGDISRPSPVLSTGHHLSYPFVFRHGGAIWMLPEQSAGGGLDLYRADPFPSRWTHEARLISDRLHDATLFEYDGLLWIAAGCETLQSSSWDGLALYWATSLTGPWTVHRQNPVVIDARSARPAGSIYAIDGSLYRPAQDCSRSYGGRLTINRIMTLTRDTFAEVAVGNISFAGESRVLGPHTLGRAGGFEVIDLYARPGHLRTGYRGPITL